MPLLIVILFPKFNQLLANKIFSTRRGPQFCHSFSSQALHFINYTDIRKEIVKQRRIFYGYKDIVVK